MFTKQDFHDLERALTKTDSKSSASPQLVSFVDKLPGYMAAATENETGIHDLDDDDAFFDDPKDTISDEDDYVLFYESNPRELYVCEWYALRRNSCAVSGQLRFLRRLAQNTNSSVKPST